VESPEFVRRLSPDPLLAREGAFALFVLAHLAQTGLLPDVPLVEGLPEAVAAVSEENPHVLAFFADTARRDSLAELDPAAARDLGVWARAQRLEREEPQVAYELGILALGVTLPPVLVRSLRQLELAPDTRVAELPDGSGYPTVFCAGLHPHWRAAEHACLLVRSDDARQLAGWAFLLLTGRLAPPQRGIQVVPAPGDHGSLASPRECDVALVYNPAPDVATVEGASRLVRPDRYVVV
jgi:hypothetical protein